MSGKKALCLNSQKRYERDKSDKSYFSPFSKMVTVNVTFLVF